MHAALNLRELLGDAAGLALVVIGLFALLALVATRRAHWAEGFRRRRGAIALLVAAAVVLVEVTEDVLGSETGAIDQALLLALHHVVPVSWLGFFQAATLTGSARVLMPAAGIAAVLLWIGRHPHLALRMAVIPPVASLVIYVAKASVARVRPALWDTQWYWGSSFPSGHVLGTAAVATAAWLCLSRLWPRSALPAAGVLVAWVLVVAASRLVLGVHWPTDVIAAACAGLLLGFAVDALLAVSHRRLHARGMPPAGEQDAGGAGR